MPLAGRKYDGARTEMTTKSPLSSLGLDTSDNMSVYKAAIDALGGLESETSPEALFYKHLAVLSLARSGATEFAQSEYDRYGLARVSGHEDIMALAGRLAKDRFDASGDIEHARDSASLYEAAFQSTSGYYSGVNAATMSLLAKVPKEIVKGRAQAVLSRLSSMSGDTDEARYFIHASRAEAHYILSDKTSAAAALQAALDFDPLNYTAHAATYRQFRLLAQVHGEPMDWLKPLRAPLSVHFAGHLFSKIEDEDKLFVSMSDLIQKEDIGFGYGALAAGSDIIFAEALLEEGGDLHVILPVAIDIFKAASVSAIDQKGATHWGARFDHCLERASSIRILTDYTDWPDAVLNNYAAKVAMGEACRRARTLSSKAGQVLIWDSKLGRSFTAHHAQDWQAPFAKIGEAAAKERAQFILEFPDQRPRSKLSVSTLSKIDQSSYKNIIGVAKNGKFIAKIDHPLDAMDIVATALENSKHARIGLHVTPLANSAAPVDKPLWDCKALSEAASPGSILVSQDMAAILALEGESLWETGFAGYVRNGDEDIPAYFAKPVAK